MRRFSTLAFTAVALSSLAGCALILGSFTTDGTIGGGDGGPDSRVDGATDGGDGGPPQKVLGCSLDGIPHKVISNNLDINEQPLAIHAINGNSDRRIAYLLAPSQKARFVEVDDVKSDGSGFSPLQQAFASGIEYVGFDNFDGGFAFIGYDGSALTLRGSYLRDNDKTPSFPQAIAVNPPLTNGTSNFNTAIVPLDLANGIFFVAVSFSINNQPQQDLYAGTVDLNKGNGPGLEKIQGFASRPEFSSSSIVLDRANHQAAIIISPDKGLGDSQVLTIDFTSTPKSLGMRNLPGPQAAHVVASFMAPSVPAPGTNGASFLTGDLTNSSVPFNMFAGTLQDDKTKTFLVGDLPAPTKFDSIDDLAVDKSAFEWRFFQVIGPQLVIAGRKTGTGDGVNILWFDGKGTLRGKASGATALVPTEKVSGAAATFRSPPAAVFAQLAMMWRTEAHDVMIADVTCK